VLERDYYKVLQIDPEADPEVIAAAHHALAAKLHPETDISRVDEVRLTELNRALATLQDPVARRAYDAQRSSELVPMGPGEGSGFRRLSGGALTERMQAGPNGAHVNSLEISFGRYAGWTLGALARTDPDYLRWLSRHSSGIRYRAAILRLLGEQEEAQVAARVRK
jgi:DnaJ-class molecular chaperone